MLIWALFWPLIPKLLGLKTPKINPKIVCGRIKTSALEWHVMKNMRYLSSHL